MLERARKLTQQAGEALAAGRTAEALSLADQALELALKSACLYSGASEATTLKIGEKDRPFARWGMTEYLQWLSINGKLSPLDKADFFVFHGWRNAVQHHGIEPSETQARTVLSKVSAFISLSEEQRREGTAPSDKSITELTTQDLPIDEVKDLHPIFRGNPFLIDPDVKLVQGEKYLREGTLRRIDLLFKTRNGVPVYAEIKASSVDEDQARRYLDDLRQNHADTPFRLVWAYPGHLQGSLPNGVEGRPYSLKRMRRWVSVRRQAVEVLHRIRDILASPAKPPRSLMYRHDFEFPNVISACYFDANLATEKGTKKIGWRKQSIGRYFDLIRCLASSTGVQEVPELGVLLIKDVLAAPHYWEVEGGFRGTTRNTTFRVDSLGFEHYLSERKEGSIYRPLASFSEGISQLVDAFIRTYGPDIKEFYTGHELQRDLLHRVLEELPDKAMEFGDRIVVKELIQYLVTRFGLQATPPVLSVYHPVLNVQAKNKVTSEGYPNDMAKRLVEVAVLKGLLTCTSGVPVIRVLRTEYIRDRWTFQRVPCQNFRLNSDPRFVKDFWSGDAT